MIDYFHTTSNWTSTSAISNALSDVLFPHACISVIGSGGKTSLIMRIAYEQRARDKRILIATTTHMYIPPHYGVFEPSIDQVKHMLDHEGIAIIGRQSAHHKISWQGDAFFKKVAPYADLILIEADGSKRLPAKFPRADEPLLTPCTDAILVVSGLSALGQPAKKACHRWELACEQLEIEPNNELLSAPRLCDLLLHGYLNPLRQRFSTLPIIPVLNQADDDCLRLIGKSMIEYCTHHVITRHGAIHQMPRITSHHTHSSCRQEVPSIPTPEEAERHRLIHSLQHSIAAPIQNVCVYGLVTSLDHAKCHAAYH
jgi:xanthine dehydrogenase accessory factor